MSWASLSDDPETAAALSTPVDNERQARELDWVVREFNPELAAALFAFACRVSGGSPTGALLREIVDCLRDLRDINATLARLFPYLAELHERLDRPDVTLEETVEIRRSAIAAQNTAVNVVAVAERNLGRYVQWQAEAARRERTA